MNESWTEMFLEKKKIALDIFNLKRFLILNCPDVWIIIYPNLATTPSIKSLSKVSLSILSIVYSSNIISSNVDRKFP